MPPCGSIRAPVCVWENRNQQQHFLYWADRRFEKLVEPLLHALQVWVAWAPPEQAHQQVDAHANFSVEGQFNPILDELVQYVDPMVRALDVGELGAVAFN